MCTITVLHWLSIAFLTFCNVAFEPRSMLIVQLSILNESPLPTPNGSPQILTLGFGAHIGICTGGCTG